MFHSFLLQITNATVDTSQHAAAAIPTPVAAVPVVTTPMSLLMGSIWIMIPLLFLLLLAVFFAIERLIVISKAKKVDRNFMNNIKDYLHNGKVDSAKELCRTQNTPVARVIEKGISRLGKSYVEI